MRPLASIIVNIHRFELDSTQSSVPLNLGRDHRPGIPVLIPQFPSELSVIR